MSLQAIDGSTAFWLGCKRLTKLREYTGDEPKKYSPEEGYITICGDITMIIYFFQNTNINGLVTFECLFYRTNL